MKLFKFTTRINLISELVLYTVGAKSVYPLFIEASQTVLSDDS